MQKIDVAFFNSIQFFSLSLENSRIFTIQLDSFFLQLKDKSSYIKFSKCYSYLPLIHIFSSKKNLRFLKITLIFPKKPIETASNASKNPCSFIPQVFQTCIIPPIKKNPTNSPKLSPPKKKGKSERPAWQGGGSKLSLSRRKMQLVSLAPYQLPHTIGILAPLDRQIISTRSFSSPPHNLHTHRYTDLHGRSRKDSRPVERHRWHYTYWQDTRNRLTGSSPSYPVYLSCVHPSFLLSPPLYFSSSISNRGREAAA